MGRTPRGLYHLASRSVDTQTSVKCMEQRNRLSLANYFMRHAPLPARTDSKVAKVLYGLVFICRLVKFKFIFRRYKSFTMIPEPQYVSNLELCWRFREIKGCVVECGTWRGGMIAGMVDTLGKNRPYHLFDSFEGLPQVKEIDGPDAKAWQANKEGKYYFANCLASEAEASKAMTVSMATDYTIHKGWFNVTLAEFKAKAGIAILRLDADWYESTIECLEHLFPQVNRGGLIVIDDYYAWEGCSKAVHDYLSQHKSPCRISSYNGTSYIRKVR
jgi:O-methyltransferase